MKNTKEHRKCIYSADARFDHSLFSNTALPPRVVQEDEFIAGERKSLKCDRLEDQPANDALKKVSAPGCYW